VNSQCKEMPPPFFFSGGIEETKDPTAKLEQHQVGRTRSPVLVNPKPLVFIRNISLKHPPLAPQKEPT